MLGVAVVTAQQPAAPTPQVNLNNSDWTTPVAPFKIVGPIHYVGTKDLAAYLIATPAGHILIDGAVPSMAGAIEQSIRTLGFKPEEIRILLTTQAHFDHVGTLAHFSGAEQGQRPHHEGRRRPRRRRRRLGLPARQAVRGAFRAGEGGRRAEGRRRHHARRRVAHGDPHPGHTPGCATYTMSATDGGKTYAVVFPGSTTVNPGTRLVKDPSYPGIADDYRQTFERLASLKPDIFLAAHASFFDLEGKRARMKAEGAEALVDRDGYRQLHAQKREAFEAVIKEQSR